jgi:hypothetical protein
VDYIQLAQDRFQWRAIAKTGINLQGSIEDGKFIDQLGDY